MPGDKLFKSKSLMVLSVVSLGGLYFTLHLITLFLDRLLLSIII